MPVPSSIGETARQRAGPGRLGVLLRCALALAIGVAICEVGLRVASGLTTSLFADARRGGLDPDAPAILCMGDSNVFGVFEEVEESYPARLQAWIERRGGGARVVNLGLPGMSTRAVLERLPEELARANAIAVVVTVGVNNGWAWLPEAGIEASRPPWYESLRLARLLRLLADRLVPRDTGGGGGPVVVPHDDLEMAEAGEARVASMRDRTGREVRYRARADGDFLDEGAFAASIRRDYESMRDVCRAAGVPLVVAGYAAGRERYGHANDVLARVAAELDLPMVDARDEVEALADRLGFTQVFHRDLHPRGVGYEVVARHLHARLVELGVLEGPPAPLSTDDLRARELERPALELVGSFDAAPGSPGELALEVRDGVPGRRFTVVLWGLRPPGVEIDVERAFGELEESGDPLFELSSRSTHLRGVFDDNGHARVPLSVLYEDRDPTPFSGQLMEACYIVHGPTGRNVISRISESVELRLP